MEIQARCVFDYPTIEALTHVSSFRKISPYTGLFFASGCVLFVFVVHLVLYYVFGVVGSIFYLFLLSFILLLQVYIVFGLPRVKFKAIGKLQGSENHYIFSDTGICVTSYGNVHQGQTVYDYNMLVKVFETSNYLFLFISQNQVLIVDKRTIIGGSVSDLRDRLAFFVGGKYYSCKY